MSQYIDRRALELFVLQYKLRHPIKTLTVDDTAPHLRAVQLPYAFSNYGMTPKTAAQTTKEMNEVLAELGFERTGERTYSRTH